MRDLIRVFCTHCGAAPGQPCRSVGGKIVIAGPHMARAKAVGAYGVQPGGDNRDALHAFERYRDDALRVVFGVRASRLDPKVLGRVRREGSIDPTARWVREAIGEDVEPRLL